LVRLGLLVLILKCLKIFFRIPCFSKTKGTS